MFLRDDKTYIDHKTTKLYSALFIYLLIYYINIQHVSTSPWYSQLQSVNRLLQTGLIRPLVCSFSPLHSLPLKSDDSDDDDQLLSVQCSVYM